MMRYRTRVGFTLLELLVVIGVVAILFALTLPAILHVREASRASKCQSNLRQLGVAIQSYTDAHETFPPGGSRGASIHVSVLPHMDHADTYDMYNYSVTSSDPENTTIATIRLAFYVCPSDSSSRDSRLISATSYTANFGSGVQAYGYNGVFGNLVLAGVIRPGDVEDGLSKTAGLSEQLVHDGSRHPLRRIWQTPTPIPAPENLDLFARECADLDIQGQTGAIGHGAPWTLGQVGTTMYNHVLTPNQKSCTNSGSTQEGAYTAASGHSGGVFVMAMDGHVEFVSNSISRTIWRAIGSRNGAEVANWP